MMVTDVGNNVIEAQACIVKGNAVLIPRIDVSWRFKFQEKSVFGVSTHKKKKSLPELSSIRTLRSCTITFYCNLPEDKDR